MVHTSTKSIALKSYTLLCVFLVLCLSTVFAQSNGDYRTSNSGTFNWTEVANWEVYNSGWGAATEYPGQSVGTGDVLIEDGAWVTLDVSPVNSISSFTFADGTDQNTRVSFGNSTLTVTGAVTLGDPDSDTGDQWLNINDGTLNCNSIELKITNTDNHDNEITINDGTINCTGNLMMYDAEQNRVTVTGAAQLNIGGVFQNGSFVSGSSTVHLSSSIDIEVWNYVYNNLRLSGNGVKTLRRNTEIRGSSLVLDAKLNLNNYYLRLFDSVNLSTTVGYSSSVMIDFTDGGFLWRDSNDAGDIQIEYPVGAGGEYTPFEITSIDDVTGNLFVRLYDARSSFVSGSDNALTRNWNITLTNISVTSVSATFTYTDSDVAPPITESNLNTVGRFDGTDWQLNETGVSYNHGSNQLILSNAVNLKGYWTLGEATGCFDGLPSGKFTVRDGNWDDALTWNGNSLPATDGSEDITIFHNISTKDENSTAHVNSVSIEPGAFLNLRRMALTVDNDVNVYGTIRDTDVLQSLVVNGNLNVLTGGTIDLEQGVITVNGNLVVDGSIADSNPNGSLNVTTNLLVNSGATFDLQNSVTTVTGATSVDGTITDTDIDGSNTFTGLLTVNSGGSFYSNKNIHTFSGGIANNGSFQITSEFTVSNDATFSGASPIEFINNLIIDNGITLTNENTGGLDVWGVLNGSDGTSTFVNKALLLYNSQTDMMLTGVLDASSFPNTVSLDRDGNAQYAIGGSYYNLNLATDGNKYFRDHIVVLNDLTTSGSVNTNFLNNNLNVGGTINHTSSGSFTIGTGNVTYDGTADQNIASNINYTGNLIVDANGIKSLTGEINVTGNIEVLGATLNLNSQTLTPVGNITIANSATLDINDNATLQLADAAVLTNNGILKVVGTAGNQATITTSGSGGYQIIQSDASAEFHALYAVFYATGGITISDGTVDATNNFGNSTFSNGTGQEYLQLTNLEPVGGLSSIQSAAFEAGPTYNVSRTAGTSSIEFVNVTGAFAGEAFDNDPGNLVDWVDPVQLTWNGSVSTDWNNANNWTASSGGPIVPTAVNSVIIANVTDQPILTVSGQQTGDLTVNDGATITINTADALGIDLDVNGDVQIDGTLQTISTNDNITVEGNWTRGATGVASLNGNVTFDGVGEAKIINNQGTNFHSLTIGGMAEYQLGSTTTIDDDVIINAGSTFDLSSSDYTLTVNGDWFNNGTLNAQQRTVIFSASSGPRQIHAGSSAFYNLDINASGVTYTLTSDLTTNEVTNILAGTVNAGTNTFMIGDGSGTDEINITGTLQVNDGATLDMANNASLTVNSGGEIELLGTDTSNRATLKSSSTGRYSFDVLSGGSIKAQYYQVDYLDADGLYMHAGATIDATNNLSDGIFSNGAAGGTYLTLLNEMGATETVRNLVFNAGPTYNVTRTSGTTIFDFEDASGVLGNYLFEEDDEATPSPSSGLLRWSFVNLYTWQGGVSNDWFDAGNWYNDVLPDAGSTITIPAAGAAVIDNSTAVEIYAFDITSGGTLTLAAGGQLTTNGDVNTADGFIIQNTNVSPASYISNGNVNGNVTVEWTYDNQRWWFIGHAISNPLMSSYDALLPGNDYAIFDYQESDNMVKISKTAYDFTTEGPLRGYIFKVKNSGANVTHTGSVNNNAVYNKTLLSEWQVIANPYPSYYQLPKQTGAGADFEHTEGSVYVTMSTSNDDKTFDTFNTLTGIGSPETFDGIIAPLQAFYVKTATAGDVYMRASNRFHDPAKVSLKSVTSDPSSNLIRLKLHNGQLTDEAVIALRMDGSYEYNRYDSEQRIQSDNKISYIYSIVDEVNSVINVLPEEIDGHSIVLGMKAQEGDHEFYIEGLDRLTEEYQIELEDKLLDVKTVIDNSTRYQFSSDVGTFDNRFELHFSKTDVATGLDEELSDDSEDQLVKVFIQNQNTLKVICDWKSSSKNIQVYNMSGQIMLSESLYGDEYTTKLNSKGGVYIVKVSDDSKVFEQKIVVK